MVNPMDLIRQLRSPENKRVLQAIEQLRARGWLEDGSLRSVPLCHVEMQGADLMKADLYKVDFHQANLQDADLSMANLSGTDLSRANLQGAEFSRTNIEGADLYKANLRKAHHLTDEQFSTARRLYGAIMPDGETYDGRYNLKGDLVFARWGGIDPNDPEAMAKFLGVPVATYLNGQRRTAQAVIEKHLER